MDSIATLQNVRSKRASSWDRSGKNVDWITIAPGKSATLLEETGAGCIRHFYWAYVEADEAKRLNMFRGVVLKIFWDGSDKPSVEVPLGDFFGVTNGPESAPSAPLAFVTNPGFYQEAQRSWGLQLLPAHALRLGSPVRARKPGRPGSPPLVSHRLRPL